MDDVLLYEEYRLIERGVSEIHAAWRGVHLLLFFLAFIFGAFATFSFHMIMYLFDEKCVLNSKLKTLPDSRHGGIIQFMSNQKGESLPVDFLETQWSDDSVCYLPLYVPLLSSIFGLIWTAMFLMLSSGMQRSYRIMPMVCIFASAMGLVSLYTSVLTQSGLSQLCETFTQITGGPCADTINVITLVYERRIRAVYQATTLAIISSWLHTTCWLAVVLIVILRVLFLVDYHLVHVQVQLKGNLDKMLQQYEKHIHTVYPMGDTSAKQGGTTSDNVEVYYKNTSFREHTQQKNNQKTVSQSLRNRSSKGFDKKYLTPSYILTGSSSIPEERQRLETMADFDTISPKETYISEIAYDSESGGSPSRLTLVADDKGTIASKHNIIAILKQSNTVKSHTKIHIDDGEYLKKLKSSLKGSTTQTNKNDVEIYTDSEVTLKPIEDYVISAASSQIKIEKDETLSGGNKVSKSVHIITKQSEKSINQENEKQSTHSHDIVEHITCSPHDSNELEVGSVTKTATNYFYRNDDEDLENLKSYFDITEKVNNTSPDTGVLIFKRSNIVTVYDDKEKKYLSRDGPMYFADTQISHDTSNVISCVNIKKAEIIETTHAAKPVEKPRDVALSSKTDYNYDVGKIKTICQQDDTNMSENTLETVEKSEPSASEHEKSFGYNEKFETPEYCTKEAEDDTKIPYFSLDNVHDNRNINIKEADMPDEHDKRLTKICDDRFDSFHNLHKNYHNSDDANIFSNVNIEETEIPDDKEVVIIFHEDVNTGRSSSDTNNESLDDENNFGIFTENDTPDTNNAENYKGKSVRDYIRQFDNINDSKICDNDKVETKSLNDETNQFESTNGKTNTVTPTCSRICNKKSTNETYDDSENNETRSTKTQEEPLKPVNNDTIKEIVSNDALSKEG